MSRWWTVCLDMDNAAPLGRLRRNAAIEVCEHDGRVWLRGKDVEGEVEQIFRRLPGRRFEILADQQLLPAGQRVPKGHLPSGRWLPLSEWISLRMESAAFAGQVARRVELRIVRGGDAAEANVLCASSDAWAAYVATAPQIRIDRLSFAMNEQGDVLIRGTPLPPIQGRRMVEDNGICLETGWTCRPAVDSDVIRDHLALERDDLAVFHRDGSWDHVRGDGFVRATRSAVRLSVGDSHDA